MARPDYGRARWYGAHTNGYSRANRPGSNNINKIIIHITQGSWSSAINWFNDSRSQVSAHYVVRSSDGFIGQCVQEKDIPYHAGNWPVNQTSIGIEHEGYGSQSRWLTSSLYNSSARLSAHLSDKYNIPVDRNHFLGHKQVSATACPGSHWDWDRYLRLVRSYKNGGSSKTYKQVVDNASRRFRATRDWGTSTYSSQKAGKNYRFIRPKRGPGSAKFIVRFPRRGRYAIYARWPANSGYNPRARFLIRTTSGWKVRVVNQRRNGGRWVRLGVFTMPKGDGSFVRLAKRSNRSGYIIADAVLVKKV